MLLLVFCEIIIDTKNVHTFLQVTLFQSSAEYNSIFLKDFPPPSLSPCKK